MNTEKAKELPASALLFPLSMRIKDAERGLVRSVLSVNEQEKSLIFAGDIPMGSYCKLMKANNIKFESNAEAGTVVYVAVDNKFIGYIVIADKIKKDSEQAIKDAIIAYGAMDGVAGSMEVVSKTLGVIIGKICLS